ncbi:hypothetical protein HMI54_000825 [Coelomomyces lativittatus]|nr:hypothetical protein HMI54_000825 [Coelomomyces lativittatus]
MHLSRTTEKFVYSVSLLTASSSTQLNTITSNLTSHSSVTLQFDSLHPIYEDSLVSSFRVQLNKNTDFLSPQFKHHSMTKEASSEVISYLECFYSGSIENFSESSVSVNLCEGLHGVLSLFPGHKFSIHSAYSKDNQNPIYILTSLYISPSSLKNTLKKRQISLPSSSSTVNPWSIPASSISNVKATLVPRNEAGEVPNPVVTVSSTASATFVPTSTPILSTAPSSSRSVSSSSPTPTPLTVLVTLANDPVRVKSLSGTTLKRTLDLFITLHQLFLTLLPQQPVKLILKNVLDLQPTVNIPPEQLSSSSSLTKWWSSVFQKHRDGADVGYLITMNSSHFPIVPSACSLSTPGIPVGIVPGSLDPNFTLMQLAHAIGHTLGMRHENRPECQGIMQFPVPKSVTSFSSCSAKELAAYFSQRDLSTLKKNSVSTNVEYLAIGADLNGSTGVVSMDQNV